MIRGIPLLTAGAAAVVVLAGCGYEETPVPEPPPESSHSPAPRAECATTDATLESEPADGTVEPGSTVDRIRKQGLLRVGVSADTFLMAARDPASNRIQGFDIEVVKAIGEAIFGPTESGFNLNTDVQLRVITAADRIPLLGGEGHEQELDLVVRNFTVNCSRKEEIAFSAVYYEATQKVLLGVDEAADYEGPASLADKRVCAPVGSTSLDNITDKDIGEPEAIVSPAANHTGCLIKFQRGEVDAITGDDTVLAGLAAQDPYAVVPLGCDDPALQPGEACQEPLSDEPYGVGVNIDDPDFVAFVNHALEEMVESDAWQRAYNRFLRSELGAGSPPEAIR